MQILSENMKKYGEEMTGKFHKFDGNKIVISVIKPFVAEIRIECDYDIYQKYGGQDYLLLDPQADPPDFQRYGRRVVYYNTQEKCYYRSEGSGNWVEVYSADIQDLFRLSEKLKAHFRRCRKEIYKGQLCFFRGYTIDPKGDLTLPSMVESMFDRYRWYYDPFSFDVEPLDQNTIDDFVAEIPISKEMTDKMVRHHKSERKNKRRAKKRESWQNFVDTCRKFVQFVEKYPTWFAGIIGAIVGSVCTFFLGNIVSIWKWFSKLFEG